MDKITEDNPNVRPNQYIGFIATRPIPAHDPQYSLTRGTKGQVWFNKEFYTLTLTPGDYRYLDYGPLCLMLKMGLDFYTFESEESRSNWLLK